MPSTMLSCFLETGSATSRQAEMQEARLVSLLLLLRNT